MPTRKIKDLNNQYCRSPDHGVPTHQYFENGMYEHTCSACGKKTIFEVNRPTFQAQTPKEYKPALCGYCEGRGIIDSGWNGWFSSTGDRCDACNGTGRA